MAEALTLLPPAEPHVAAGARCWRFTVQGEAVPQGSFKAITSKVTGYPMLKADNETALNRWRRHVTKTAIAAVPAWLAVPLDAPVYVGLVLVRERSPNDFLADGVTLRKGARRLPDTAPDNDKVERAIFDALTGVAFVNDGRVVGNSTWGRFGGPGETSRVEVTVIPL